MYKLMFADDEALIRRNMTKIVQWENFGFELIGCCENGHELLELIEHEVPDLVITDINMPFIDGIEVARQLKQMNPRVKIVFLTGYNDFEYAQKAVDLNVLKYILKPITVEEIQNVLIDVKKILDEEVTKNSNIHNLEEFYEQNKPIMQSVFLSNLLVEPFSPDDLDDIESKIKVLELERLMGEEFLAAVVLIDHVVETSEWKNSQSLMEFAVYNILKEILDEKKIGYGIIGNKRINIILSNKYCKTENTLEEFMQVLEEICICINKYLNFTVTIGVGTIKDSLTMINQSSNEANAAIGYRNIVGNNRLIYINDIESHRITKQTVDFAHGKKLLNVIKMGNLEELKQLYQEIIEEIEKEQLTLEQMRIWGMMLIFNLYRDVESMGVNVSEILDFNVLKNLLDTWDYQDMYNYLLNFCIKLLEAISLNRMNSFSIIVDGAIKIIDKNYDNPDLSVDMVSSMVNLSASYFRSIFKKEMGKTFGKYVTEVRMKKAKDFILTTNMKNYEIAEATGYTDPHYFSYCFKKHFNMSPSELRVSINQGM